MKKFEELVKNQKVESLENMEFPKAKMPELEKMDKVLGEETKSKDGSRVKNIDPRNIVEEEGFNVRFNYDLETLKASIKANGVQNPLQGFYDQKNKTYVLIDGHRRFRAVMELIDEGTAIKTVPMISVSKKPDVGTRTLSIFLHNDSKPLSNVEKGVLFRRLVKYGYSQKEIAEKTGTTQGRVSQLIKLGSYPKLVLNAIENGEISEAEVGKISKFKEVKNDDDKLVETVEEAVQNKTGKTAKATDTKAGKAKKEKEEKQEVNQTVESLIKKYKPVADRNDLPSDHLNFFVEALELITSGNDSVNDMIELVTEYAKASLVETETVESEAKTSVKTPYYYTDDEPSDEEMENFEKEMMQMGLEDDEMFNEMD